MLALRELAGDLVDVELLSPEHHFWYRPLAVAEPFERSLVRRYELPAMAHAAGVAFTPGALAAVEADRHVVRTSRGVEIEYDVLVVALGAKAVPAIEGALTFRGPSDADRFGWLLGEIEEAVARRVAFVLPTAATWSLPLYELALLTREHLDRRGIHDAELSVVTPESSPLSALGRAAGDVVSQLLGKRRIRLHCGRHVVSFGRGRLELAPAGSLLADRVVALARPEGHSIPGVPHDRDGFVEVDGHGRVTDLEDVYAAGDITRFPVKQGGIAAQQADAVAESIAACAGADLVPSPFEPVVHALMLTGREPVYIRAEIPAGPAEASTDPLWWPPSKIAGRHLAPFLATLESDDTYARSGRAVP